MFATSCLLVPLRSAGVGRTGTFIVIDSMIDMMHMEQRVDVFGSVSRIREQRCQLIQTDVSVDPSRPPGSSDWQLNLLAAVAAQTSRGSGKREPCLWCQNRSREFDKTKLLAPLWCLLSLRCSTPSSTRLCWSTSCTETPSWMCALWRAICTGFTTPGLPTTGWAWRRSSG